MNRILFLLIILLFSPFFTIAQKEIDGTVSAGDSVNVFVKSSTPKTSPIIEVLFKAEDNHGYPYWGLEKKHLIVREGMTPCQVISLRHLTDNEPINIVLVLDHSGSMEEDASALYDSLDPMDSLAYASIDWEAPEVRALITSPLEDAKAAILKFIPNFDAEKDQIGLIAFNHEVSIDLAVGSSESHIKDKMKSLQAEGGTAFYDAVQRAIENLKGLEGINVVIALTDGQDGSSKSTPDDIIQTANDENVLVYCIGLGYADSNVLGRIADETEGYFAKASNSSSLDSVYQVLERKIQAYYVLNYSSETWSSDAIDRGFTLRFRVQEEAHLELPEEVKAFLKQRSNKTDWSYALYGGGGIVLVSALGMGVWYFRKKRPKKLEIVRTFPNPGDGHITLTVKLPAEIVTAQVKIMDHRGSLVMEADVQTGENKLDISTHARGFYEIILTHPLAKSAQRKYLKNR